MPSVPIKDLKQYQKAMEVLERVGGTWQGVGIDDWHLLVTLGQYDALVQAGVVTPVNGKNGRKVGKNGKKKRDSRKDA